MLYIILYLVAIVAANLSIAYFGINAAIINAFLFISLDLTSRDKLHDKWHGKNLWLKMALLIATGSILSYLLNRNSGQIAIASFIAFLLAGISDTIVYHLLREKTYMVRVNGSNVVSSAVDSIVFPLIAFGAFYPLTTLGLFAAKIIGGFFWSWALRKKIKIPS
jgi:queuosine precursor transporter